MTLSLAGRPLLVLAGLATLAGCQSEPAETPAPAGPARTAEPAPDPPAADAGGPAGPAIDRGEPVRLVAMAVGDRACVLTVQPDGGETRTDLAEFELCGRSDLVGRRVRLTSATRPVAAESCQGDPACGETELADVVTSIRLAEDAVAGAAEG